MERIWIDNYEPGVRSEIDLKEYKSISDMFNTSVNKYFNQKAFTNFWVSLTYGESKRLIDKFSSYLQNNLKLEKGSRIAIMMPNLIQYPIVIYGALQAGLIVVNVNPLYTPRELEYQLKDSEAETIVIAENFADTLEAVIERTNIKNIILCSIGDLLGIKGKLINFALRRIKKQIPSYNLPQAIKFNNAIRIASKNSFNPINVTLEDIAFIQYTGGTTGVAKGAMLTHGNICANLLQAKEWTKVSISKVEKNNVIFITPLPLYHVFSLTISLMLSVVTGAENVLITNPRDIAALIKDLKKYKFTVLTGVNTLFNALVSNPEFKTVDFSNCKIVLGGGAAVQRIVADKWKKITGIPLLEAYGLTECSPGVCVNPMNLNDNANNIGIPVPMTDIDIRDDDGKSLGVGEAGELFVKAPQVMKGYWNKDEETDKVLKDGWLATGDIVIMDEKGYLKLVDRKKDIVIVSGFNVYPNEVEDVIASYPGVREVACIGVSNRVLGETLKVFIVKDDDNLTSAEIIKHCRENLVSYKIPRKIEFKDELPKSNIGKILRRKLREENEKKKAK